jgi:hypothetical protein
MMMDSDCIMKKGSLDLLIDGLSNTDLSKGDVKYLSNDFSTKLIAKVRQGNASNLTFRQEFPKSCLGMNCTLRYVAMQYNA